MTSLVTITVEFSFKGEQHRLSVLLNLDDYMIKAKGVPDFHALIARNNNIDLYSYEFEMMQASTIKFSEAEGLVAEHVNDGELDLPAFEQVWNELRVLKELEPSLKEKLGIEDLKQQPELKDILLEAYRLGTEQ